VLNTLVFVFYFVTNKPVTRINSTLLNRTVNSINSKLLSLQATCGIYTFRQILQHIEKLEHGMSGEKINLRFVRLSAAHGASLIPFH